MNTQPNQFCPSRLREIREVRGFTQTQLADLLSVTNATVSAYEKGRSKPSPAVLDSMPNVLQVPPAFFLRDARPVREGVAYYRSLHSATKRARARAEHRLAWLQDITEYLGTLVELPAVNLPTFDLPADPMQITDADVEEAASMARAHWGLGQGPVPNLVRLLEHHGVIVTIDALQAQALDSLCYRTPERPFVMIGAEKATAARWRYDAAHELGHLLLHSDSRLRQRDVSNSVIAAQIEAQAHKFAGAFLLPLGPFANEFYSASLDTLYRMKSVWRVSIGAMINRASKAELISKDTAQRLWINYSRRGWRRSEPLDDQLEREYPKTLYRAEQIVLDKGHTVDELRQAVTLADRDIETLCGLPEGFLRAADSPPLRAASNVVPMRFR